MYYVYCIQMCDNKKYIGCTKNLNRRKSEHKYKTKFLQDIDFSMVVLFQSSDRNEALQIEKEKILEYDTVNPLKGYNRRYGDPIHGKGPLGKEAYDLRVEINRKNAVSGEDHPLFGKIHTAETRQKMRLSALARPPRVWKKYTKEEIIQRELRRGPRPRGKESPNYGKKHTPESIQKMRETKKGWYLGEKNPYYGKKHSEETRAKMRGPRAKGVDAASYGRKQSAETRAKISATKKANYQKKLLEK